MFESVIKFFKNLGKKESTKESSDTAKERLHLVLMQDRANVSADFLELMKQEIIEVIKKYIEVDEKAIDVRLTNKSNEDGTVGAPALYANIPIATIKNEVRKVTGMQQKAQEKKKPQVNEKEVKVSEVTETKAEKKKNSTQEEKSVKKESKTKKEETAKKEDTTKKKEEKVAKQEPQKTESKTKTVAKKEAVAKAK